MTTPSMTAFSPSLDRPAPVIVMEVSRLLSDAQELAYRLKEDASAMDAYTRSNVRWESYAETVGRMQEHINAAGLMLARLDDARKIGSAWQATAIDRIRPLLKVMASNTENAFSYVSADPNRQSINNYLDCIENNADVSSQLADLVADFVNCGNAKSRLACRTAS